ncbi:DeoR family transcriptional regulator, fructose operon transcriptional repressor [Amycolatopsis xylanica]|uniref:Lactose phosphotransferase system repressor n=1 Tax=Amycolatopsis xylanica TaxID=589385 RepID=A0A1H3GYI3_9PSEU|nr:DeoR/GlpR family DNA-binding transcription regulator [Amycolatopsis xylanica]SDY08366.1 DeoR family transcriptional regulator, fructose operon transcriptional repressor [Amycolatopsis xylanica]
MYAQERQQLILDRARLNGRVDVAALAEEFAVTMETIRRDLTVLEQHGVLRRVHGGAIPAERLGFEAAVETREGVMTSEKDRIAKAALEQLPAGGGTILLDAGTTTARLAALLPPDCEMTVVTHSVGIAMTLATRANLTVMLVGGRLRGRTLASVDAWALHALSDTYVDVAFLGTNGFSVARGLTTPDSAEAMVKRAAISAARRCVLLADHTKAGNDQFARFGTLADLDILITDSALDTDLATEIAAAGPQVITV